MGINAVEKTSRVKETGNGGSGGSMAWWECGKRQPHYIVTFE